jgi:hypothetical protein
MMSEILTGRTRYRIESRIIRSDLIVLQVEVSNRTRFIDHYGGSSFVESKHWRDATLEDLNISIESNHDT